MIVNKASAVAVEKAFRAVFTKALHGAGESVFWTNLATKFDTSAGELDLSWLANIPGMKELKGTAEIANLELVTWLLQNKEYHDTIAVKVKDIERDQLGVYTPRMELLGDAAARHPDELAAEALLAGFTTKGKDYTGKKFFDTGKKHFPSGKSTFDNVISDALADASFEEARTMLKTQKIVFPDGSETKLKLGKDLCLIVGPVNESTGRQILSAERDAAGATNVNKDTAKLEVWNELGDSTAWFLMDKGHPVKPLALSMEKAPSLASVTDPDDSHVLLKKEFLHQVYGRWTMGYFLPQLIVGSTGDDA